MAAGEKKLFGSPDQFNTSGLQTNAIATATLVAPGLGKRLYLHFASISVSGAAGAANRATLAWTQGGAAQTLGFAASAGIWQIIFGQNAIETDENTAITLTIPALGAAVNAEAALIGFVGVS